MAPKAFKRIEIVEQPIETTNSERPFGESLGTSFGEQSGVNATVNYGGARRTTNCTVNAQELQAGIAKQRAEFAKLVAEHQEYKRVPKGRREQSHKLPVEEQYLADGDVKLTRPVTKTVRKER